MNYDPKKSRPKGTVSRSIIDEIIEEPLSSAHKTPVQEDKSPQELPPSEEKSEKKDNVIPLYEETETPLIMQPQVWIATGVAALLLLMFVKRRKKH